MDISGNNVNIPKKESPNKAIIIYSALIVPFLHLVNVSHKTPTIINNFINFLITLKKRYNLDAVVSRRSPFARLTIG